MTDDNDLAALRRDATRMLRDLEPDAFAELRTRGMRSAGPAARMGTELREGAAQALVDLRAGRVSADGRGWAARFLATFLGEIRGAICAEKPGHSVEGLTARGAASAVAGWAVGALGLSSPFAFGIATLVVLVLGSSLRTSFCRMTEAEVLAGLGKA